MLDILVKKFGIVLVGSVEIDSMRILVPANFVLSVPSDLLPNNFIYHIRKDGEVLKVEKAKFFLERGKDKYFSEHLDFSVVTRSLPNLGKYYEFFLSSRTASARNYLDGICRSSIVKYFENLTKYGFSFAAGFLNSSYFYDFDLKQDFKFNDKGNLPVMLKNFRSSVRSCYPPDFVIKYEKDKVTKENVLTGGYQYGRKGFPASKVYFKIYDKFIDNLRTRKVENLEQFRGLYRFELTVKNYSHLKFLCLESNKIKNVGLEYVTFLNLIKDFRLRELVFKHILNYCFPSFENVNIKRIKNDSDSLKGKDILIEYLFNKLCNYDSEEMFLEYCNIIESDLFSKVQKTRFKKLFRKILFS